MTPPTTSGADLEELERLLEAGTPGPWIARVSRDIRSPRRYVTGLMNSEGREPPDSPPKFYIAFLPDIYPDDSAADAALIVAAVNALPALLARIEALETALASHHGTVIERLR